MWLLLLLLLYRLQQGLHVLNTLVQRYAHLKGPCLQDGFLLCSLCLAVVMAAMGGGVAAASTCCCILLLLLLPPCSSE
jgi:hypothetical protein